MEENNLYYSIPKQLGLSPNDILFIASDVKKMALDSRANGFSFDASYFIECFQNTVINGSLIIPAYTDYLKNGDAFDYEKSKPSTGALSNRVMKRKDFVRSLDPLHSVFAWGRNSADISKINSESTLGKGSIFDFLDKNKAKMICIDVDFQDSLTFVHYVEEKLNVNYRKPFHWKMKVKKDGEEIDRNCLFYTKKSWVLTDLDNFQEDAILSGIVKELKIGNSTILLFDVEVLHHFIENYIKSGKKLYKISILEYLKNIARKILRK